MSSAPVQYTSNLQTLDRFAGTAASDLAAHVPDVGPGWTNLAPAHGTLKLDGAGGIYSAGAAVNQYALYCSGAMAAADYWAQMAITPQTQIDRAFVMVRASAPAGAVQGYAWGLRCDMNPPGLRLGRITADNFVNLATPPQGVPFGVAAIFTLQVIGTTLGAFLNGQLVAQVTDANFAGPGQAGIAINLTTVQAPATGPLASQFMAWL